MFHENHDDLVFPEIDSNFMMRLSKEMDHDISSVRANPGISLKCSSISSKYYDKEEKRSLFSNISIKIQTQTYHLNKAMLALHSGYFEKLLIDDSEEKECAEIEIHAIDEDSFSSIVDHIYGAKLRREGKNNIQKAMLFMAMNYLQMEINLYSFHWELDDAKWSNPDEIPSTTFKWYYLVSSIPEYEPLLYWFRKCFSNNLLQISKVPEFMSLSPTALIEILLTSTSQRDNRFIGKICAGWICYDFQNRLPHIIDLVNAAKHRYGHSSAISSGNFETIDEPDEIKRRQIVEKYFYKLLNCCTEISPKPITADIEKLNKDRVDEWTVFKIDYDAKWKTFLEKQCFTDVSIRIGEEVFRLHRMKLSLEIPYFNELFSQSTVQKEYSLDATIDSVAFKKIVNYIYHEEIDVINESQLSLLLEACKILQMEQLLENIIEHVLSNLDKMKGNIFDFLEYVLENEYFSKHRQLLDSYIGLAFHEVCQLSKFYEASFEILQHLITLPQLRLENEQYLLNICSKWIHHDMKNRYKLIPEVALAINRNGMVNYQKYSLPLPEDSSAYSEEHILEQLNNILSLTQLVPSISKSSEEQPKSKPCIMVSKNNTVSVLDENFEEIFSLSSHDDFQHTNLSAVLVEDNLFMLFHKTDSFSFQVYNLYTKKITGLTFNLKSESTSSKSYLLTCNNTLYFYVRSHSDDDNAFSKYSYKLNRWITGFENGKNHYYDQFYTSNEKVVFKVLKKSYGDYFTGQSDYDAQLYNFEKKSWIKLPNLPTETRNIRDVSIIDDELSVLCDCHTAIYRQENRRWEIIAHTDEKFTTFKQVNDSILYVTRKGLVYSFSIASNSWQFIKKLEGVHKIVTIHSVN